MSDLFRFSSARKFLTGRRSNSPKPVPLGVEELADRIVPATVTNLDADGPGSLRDAIENTTDATVDFAPGLTGTITLTNASGDDIDIDRSLTINGPGADVITVSGNDETRIFDIASKSQTAEDVVISGLTLTQGNEPGGAIRILGENFTLTDSVLTGNTAGASGGGAIYQFEGSLTILRTVFSGNSSTSGGGAVGALFTSNFLVEDSTFTRNTSAMLGGSVYIGAEGAPATIRGSTFTENSVTEDGDGGAVYINRAADGLIENSTFTGNTTPSDGGAVYIEGDDESAATFTIRNSTFATNSAGFLGGAVGSDGNGGRLVVQNSTFERNQTTLPNSFGGAVYEEENAAGVLVENSTFVGNISGGEGGALQLLGNCGKLTPRLFGPDGDAPLGQGLGPFEPLGDRAECRSSQPHTPLVHGRRLPDDRADAPPSHRPGPPQDVRHRPQQRPVPVPPQNPPAPLDRVILAVVRRQVHELDGHPVPVREPDHPLQKLGPRTGHLGAVVQLDVQPRDAGVGRRTLGPPPVQAVGQEVTRLP